MPDEGEIHIDDISEKGPLTEILSDGQTVVMRDDDVIRLEVTRRGEDAIALYRHPETGDVVWRSKMFADGSTEVDLSGLDPDFWSLTVDGEDEPVKRIETLDNVSIKIDVEQRQIQARTKS